VVGRAKACIWSLGVRVKVANQATANISGGIKFPPGVHGRLKRGVAMSGLACLGLRIFSINTTYSPKDWKLFYRIFSYLSQRFKRLRCFTNEENNTRIHIIYGLISLAGFKLQDFFTQPMSAPGRWILAVSEHVNRPGPSKSSHRAGC
jgi:hypothetical protein